MGAGSPRARLRRWGGGEAGRAVEAAMAGAAGAAVVGHVVGGNTVRPAREQGKRRPAGDGGARVSLEGPRASRKDRPSPGEPEGSRALPLSWASRDLGRAGPGVWRASEGGERVGLTSGSPVCGSHEIACVRACVT